MTPVNANSSSQDEFLEAEKICGRATPGPWSYGVFTLMNGRDVPSDAGTRLYRVSPQLVCMAGAFRVEDAVFVAAAREGWPRALAALREARAELHALKNPTTCPHGHRHILTCEDCLRREQDGDVTPGMQAMFDRERA